MAGRPKHAIRHNVCRGATSGVGLALLFKLYIRPPWPANKAYTIGEKALGSRQRGREVTEARTLTAWAVSEFSDATIRETQGSGKHRGQSSTLDILLRPGSCPRGACRQNGRGNQAVSAGGMIE
ncbi:hypothetical protein Ppro_1988 [Pelobacter propionicus DSM 2379]|uniref:Uncharacterized protein n=1 Tax=Pelobacter propionicus (strain DSM 2379 / NBRC 103807 / OttBd1) TaxID=338966 RepID=A1AQH6_PELPD|nr:hypothetical protein Ppro_1988 [Pelobacter propionicus DSM 2379]